MEELLDQSADMSSVDNLEGITDIYGYSFSYDSIYESVQEASDFFSISDPLLAIESYATGVYNNIPFTEADDVLIFNRQQLSDMVICERDGLDLVMTHECAHRALQGMDLGFDAHQEELCCDYMAGVRAGLNDIDISPMVNSLRDTLACESHPAGLERVDAIEAGVQFAQDFMNSHLHAPTFDDCLNDFRINNDLYDAENQTLWDHDDISFKGYGGSGRLELSDRLNHINDIYDGQIERAYDKLADDMERISKDGPYAWENPDATIKADKSAIERLEQSKREAIGQARVDQSKQDYWDSVSDYCDAVFSQKIHGK